MYPGLTNGAAAALLVHANDEIKQTYLPKLTSGEWTGTMNLTEPHCGTDLGLIKTKATRNGDGSFAITGPEDLHLLRRARSRRQYRASRARPHRGRAGGREGHFAVRRAEISVRGRHVGERNGLVCGSIEHKMGIHGNSTCVMNFDGAKGWLVGEENRGLNAMFVMMNGARLGVAVQGLAQSEVAYQNAAAYAKERLQGRSLTGAKAPDKPADPILVHPDVRRMLLEIRSFNEAARALMVSVALTEDEALGSPDEKARQAADDRIGLLTPGAEGRVHRHRLRQCGEGAAGARRPRLYRGMGHGAVRARRPHRHDLRGRQRHPGARPRRPQAAEGRRPRDHRLLRRGQRLPRARTRRTRRWRPISRRSRPRSASCSRRRCG